LGTKNKHFSLRYLAKKREKAKNKERFHEEAVLYFFKKS